jgi:hypothetical protein
MIFASPTTLALAALLAIAACIVAIFRRPFNSPSPGTPGEGWGGGPVAVARRKPPPSPSPGVPREGRVRSRRCADILLATGATLVVFAAGDPTWLIPGAQRVAVMVDLSPSTRTAAYRQPDLLRRRIGQLLGDTPYDVVFFSDRNTVGLLSTGTPLTDLPAEKTIFSPPPCAAVLLFGDGRFAPPADSPPVFPVLDPLLAGATDASITGMEFVGGNLAVHVANNGPPRVLTLHGVSGPATQQVVGNQTILRPLAPSPQRIWAELSPGDAWPENDAMSIPSPPPANAERWWVGAGAPDQWRAFSPADLPVDAASYLTPGIIVLNNISADELSLPVQQRLQQYVRDLDGALLILGGDHAFASGGYDGTILASLSPLISSPPAPATRWILLADASGSMSQDNRWDRVAAALVQVIPRLPPSDPVRVGQFSDTLSWWCDMLPARQVAALALPPSGALPHGPTNLQPALEAIATLASPGIPTQLLLMTDADVSLDQPDKLSLRLKSAGIRLNLLAIERGSGLPDLEDIVRDTGGSFVTQLNPGQWPDAARLLLSGALSDRLVRQPIQANFKIAALPPAAVNPWNRAWLSPQARLLADSDSGQPLAATWRVGLGAVLSVAFTPTETQTTALADLIAQPPADPRFNVSWQCVPQSKVSVDAIDNGHYLNDLNLTVEIADQISAPAAQPIPQTGPGRYEAQLPSTGPGIATVRLDDRVIDRHALPGGYAEEFAAVGLDRVALETLAKSTGGKVTPPDQSTPIAFHWPPRQFRLTPWLAMAGAFVILVALILKYRLN